MKPQFYYPIKPCRVSQSFGVNVGADYGKLLGLKGHPGQDLVILGIGGANASFGAPVRASHNGKVIQVEKDTNGGHTVVLVTDQAYDYLNSQTFFKTVYAHCLAGSIKVKEGDKVKIGEILAFCGSSGVVPNAKIEDPALAHVHFAIKPAHFVPAVDNDNPSYWANTFQDNGFGGAIDNAPYWNNSYAEDFKETVTTTELPNTPEVISNLQQQISLLQKVVLLLKKWLKLS